jgi:membrane-associated phospholipid phosphatase
MNPTLIRASVVIAALFFWFRTQKLIASKARSPDGIADGVHRLTRPLNRYLSGNPKAADRTLIASSAIIDIMGVSLIVLSLFGPTFAPFAGLLIVFTLRQIAQFCCTLPPPAGMIWRHPGFPSALVTYHVGNDLFFSGHTALAVLAAIEIASAFPGWLGWVAIVLAIGEAFTVLALRAHYTMDVIAGALAAWWASDRRTDRPDDRQGV